MQRLRNTFDKYPRWKSLELYIERIEALIQSDFSTAIENAKALLESIGKEICQARAVEIEQDASINKILKKSFYSLGYAGDSFVVQISASLATIGQQIGNIRNGISPTSHGRSLTDLDKRNDDIDGFTARFLIDSTVIVAVFLICSHEECQASTQIQLQSEETSTELTYEDFDTFNEHWDETFGEFAMGSYSYTASEILYNVDREAYEFEKRAFEIRADFESEEVHS